ncbi:MAG: hypothetical protein ABFD83_04305 [Armatimonadota bacterium]
MDEIRQIEADSLKRNLKWFKESGIMDPADGSWGLAERIALTEDNSAIEAIKKAFTAYSDFDGYSVIEHRRPDCNFEAALMFLLAAEVFDSSDMHQTASNILHFLFRRSCTRNEIEDNNVRFMWRWASGYWWQPYYVDDNSWNGALSIMIGRRYPDLNAQHSLVDKGIETIETIRVSLQNYLDGKEQPKDQPPVSGLELSPHFAALAIMAFAHSWKAFQNSNLQSTALQYIDRVQDKKQSFSSSEHGYYLMGNACCASAFEDDCFLKEARESANYILSIMSPEGLIPSEHNEAPTGKNLVDTIYTQNWCALGLHAIWKLTGDTAYREAYERSVRLLASIQDDTPAPHFNGCWRGMYDMEKRAWGGGDKYEGGAGSIYSGWTNAPISFTFAMDILGLSLLP